MSVYLIYKFKVDFLYCAQCGKKPRKFKQKDVEDFIRKHRKHANDKLNQHLRVIGYMRQPSKLKDRKIAIRFVETKKEKK